MRKLWKIHIGILVGFVITFISIVFLVYTSDKYINVYHIPALFLTYEFLIINFLKDDFLTKEFKEKARKELSDYNYRSVVLYIGLIKFVLCACIILAPIMWSLAIISY